MLAGEQNGIKERQSSKIKELAGALIAAGFVSLDDQAKALGLSRSTTWTILKAQHKNYGLSAALINRVLCKPDLNPQVHATLVEYVQEKMGGAYGHNDTQLRRFVRRLELPTVAAKDEKLLTHKHPAQSALERSFRGRRAR